MGRVGFNEYGEGGGFEKVPDNVRLRVTSAIYERIHREAGVVKNGPRAGKEFPARDFTAAVVTMIAVGGEEKEYRQEFGCGKTLMPSEDGTYLDDREATKPSEKLLNKNTGWAVFLQSLERAGADDGTFTEDNRNQCAENIQAIVGLEFHSGTEQKDGPDGKYSALIATRVYSLGEAPAEGEAEEAGEAADPDVEVIMEKVDALLKKTENKAGLFASEILKKLTGLSKAQVKKATEAFSDVDWINQAVEGGYMSRDPKTKRLKAAA